MEKINYSEIKNRVENYFAQKGATIHINLDPSYTYCSLDGIYEYLDLLINNNELDFPGFKLQGYSFSQFDQDTCIHNFHFEQQDDDLKGEDIEAMLDNHPLLMQDSSQPKPMYTAYFGSLYITVIGEA